MYRQPLADFRMHSGQNVRKNFAKLLGTGCIEPSNSPYTSGLVLVRKKDGGLWLCVGAE